jgi:type VII secretion protein EccB
VTTTVLSSIPESDASKPLGADDALLVARAGKTYLLFDGKRAEVDPNNSVMARSLKLQGVLPRPVGTGLLDSAVEVPALAPPPIPQAGQPTRFPLTGARVGSVIKVTGVDDSELYVVLPDGVQRISPLVAVVIRNADSQGESDIVSVPPDAIDGVPVVNSLPVGHFPANVPKIVPAEDAPVACMAWSRKADDRVAKLQLLAGTSLPIPGAAHPVDLVTADGTGDRVDAAYVPPSSGEFVQATGIEPDSERHESLFYIADNGIRYGVADAPTGGVLGLGDKPKLAPWAIIGLLVPGPALSQQNALVSHDSVTPDPNAGALPAPKN